MDRRRRNTYQLSSDTFVNSNKNSEFNIADELTPISRNRRRSYITGSENNSNIDSVNPHEFGGTRLLNKVTSTPLVQWKKRESRNGDVNHHDSNIVANHQTTLRRASSLQSSDLYGMSKEDETIYSPRGSPWGTSISPKMRSKAAGVKTIQTVTGPLLTSTRYNIDPKVYTDVTSPGLTSRLTKYAAEVNMKLIHQAQYSPGQFPKVNLNTSPTPIINARSSRARTSVTVRVAPPDTAQYSSPERQKIVSSMCPTKNQTSPSVVQVLKEISLKRHASRDDISVELAKKQRTDGIYDEELENYEEITQKRGRDELSKSQEEISIDNTLLRPSKRSKMPSCYDILNSLSSSTNVSSGVKRKADISRSGTPDIGKHFKSLDDIQRSRSFSTSPPQIINHKNSNDLADNQKDNTSSKNSTSSKKLLNSASPKLVSPYTNSLSKTMAEDEQNLNVNKSPIKLTDRLFMRAEPQNIDKLKSLIEEHASVSSKFTSDDGEEIKKSDVVNMRQTSMKARLQSMFDAISGKISGEIDPNVVIQAEQVKNNSTVITTSSSTNPQLSSSALTTLNASTSTTSINTTPISTSAVTPIIGKTKTNITPGKHVTFLLPTATLSTTNNDKVSLTTTKPPTQLSSITSEQKTDSIKKFETVDNQKPSQLKFNAPAHTNSSISIPTFGSVSSTAAAAAQITQTTVVSSPSNSSTNLPTPTTSSMPSNIPNLFSPISTSSPSVIAFGTPQSTSTQKIQSNSPASFTLAPAKPVTTAATTAGFTFGSPSLISTTSANLQTSSTAVNESTPVLGFQSTATTSITTSATPALSTNLFTTNKPAMPTLFTATSVTTNSSAATTTAPTFSFGQLSSNPSSVQSTVNPPSQGTFSFGATNNSSVNLNPVTTTQTQISIKPQSDSITTPSTFTFGANNLNTTASTFGTNITSISESVPVFGSTNNLTTINTTGCTPATTSSSLFSFGKSSTTTQPILSFGASNNSQTTGINKTLTFGNPSQPSVPIFGVSNNNINNNSTNTTTSAQNLSSFGTISTANSQSNSTPGSSTMPFTFGTPSTEQSTFPSTSVNVTSTNANIQLFGAAPKSTMTSTFGMNPTTVNATANMANNTNIPAATTTSTSLFNSAGNSNTIFGQSKIMPSTGTFGTSLSTSTNFAPTAPNTFSSTGQQSLSFGTQQPVTTASVFGSSSSANNMSTSTFGTPNTTTAPAPPAFGSSNTTSTGFGSLTSITPNFASASNTDFSASRPTTNLFGTQNLSSPTAFNSTNSAFATGATTTSATTATTAPPAFGTATTSISTFGTSSGFGNTNAPTPAFGSTITNTAFGSGFSGTNSSNPISPFSNQSSNTPTFGSTNTPFPSFGTASTNNTTSSGSNTGNSGAFSFTNPSTNQSQQQNSPFTFGSANTNNNNNNSNNNPASSATPFQFGAVVAPQPGGFNFTGGSPAPSFGGSSSGSSGGGMFSIGSGSTAPRSRSTRPRRQQR
ncbi:hypothetical protein PV325_003672 [Microctonus aethiopoides]|nr:hypothetical protein PV325_003672 [Microctonus aethiopoides]